MPRSLHPLSGGSSLNFLRLALTYGVDSKYWPRFFLNLMVSAIGAPGRRIAGLRYNRRIKKFRLERPPVFVIGHWRSGTTYLHHLMGQDERFGYVTSYQAAVPEMFLPDSPFTRAIVSWNLPKKRPMDNIELSLKKPEEEEVLMANVSLYSYIHSFSFPRHARRIFHQSILFEGLSIAEKEQWGKDYVRAVKIACLGADAERPLLKSPGNTARIRTLLRLFPEARFVHIYRDPYVVFPSMRHTYLKLIESWQLQDVQRAAIDEEVLYGYEKLMQRFLQDKLLIPAGNLIEIQYESFENDQLNTLEQIYRTLGISGFEDWKPKFSEFIQRSSGYRKNSYRLSAREIEIIQQRWGFVIDNWHYSPPIPV